jgi:hypothetical protein
MATLQKYSYKTLESYLKHDMVWDWWSYCERCKHVSWTELPHPTPVGNYCKRESKCERCDYDIGREEGRMIQRNHKKKILVPTDNPYCVTYFSWFPYWHKNAYYYRQHNFPIAEQNDELMLRIDPGRPVPDYREALHQEHEKFNEHRVVDLRAL